MENDAKLHAGHRKRLLNLVMNAGLDNLTEVQVMEFILSILIPRKDTNILAHKLLNEFGSVSKVLDSDIETLKQVEGVGDRTAALLSIFPNIFSYYKKDKLKKKFTINDYGKTIEYFSALLEDKNVEELYIVGLNIKNQVIAYKLLCKGSIKSVGISPTIITTFLHTTKAAQILLGHNHPTGVCDPSNQDLEATKYIKDLTKLMGVKFLDHIIISSDGVYSIQNNSKLINY